MKKTWLLLALLAGCALLGGCTSEEKGKGEPVNAAMVNAQAEEDGETGAGFEDYKVSYVDAGGSHLSDQNSGVQAHEGGDEPTYVMDGETHAGSDGYDLSYVDAGGSRLSDQNSGVQAHEGDDEPEYV